MASSDSVSLTVKGRGGHGAHPHKSVDPITAAAYILAELQTVVSRSVAPLEAAVLTMGRIEGGTAANVIPDTVTMEGTVRTVSRETRALMEEKIRQIACHGAEALGASCEVEYKRGVPAVICDPAVVERIRKAAAEELGSENVVTRKRRPWDRRILPAIWNLFPEPCSASGQPVRIRRPVCLSITEGSGLTSVQSWPGL